MKISRKCECIYFYEKKLFYACNDEAKVLQIARNGFDIEEVEEGQNHLGKLVILTVRSESTKKNIIIPI